jgi:hypothetical protein
MQTIRFLCRYCDVKAQKVPYVTMQECWTKPSKNDGDHRVSIITTDGDQGPIIRRIGGA